MASMFICRQCQRDATAEAESRISEFASRCGPDPGPLLAGLAEDWERSYLCLACESQDPPGE